MLIQLRGGPAHGSHHVVYPMTETVVVPIFRQGYVSQARYVVERVHGAPVYAVYRPDPPQRAAA